RLLALEEQAAVPGLELERLVLQAARALRVLQVQRSELQLVLRLLVVRAVHEALVEQGLRALEGAAGRGLADRGRLDRLSAAQLGLAQRDLLPAQVGLQRLRRGALLRQAAGQLGALHPRQRAALLDLAAGLHVEQHDALRGAEQRRVQRGYDASLC